MTEPSRQGDAAADPVYLQPTPCLDADHPKVQALAQAATAGVADPVRQAVALYYAVRDGFRYNPYGADLTETGLRASQVIERGHGYCVSKAGLLAAAARVAGIPSRLGFANVRNHLATERLRRMMGTDVFYYHGYTELLLDGRWVKATPAFNAELCERFHVLPLEFDGRTDSIFHPFDADNRRHMEYLADHGTRADMPVAEIRAAMLEHYPFMFSGAQPDGDFAAEAVAENR